MNITIMQISFPLVLLLCSLCQATFTTDDGETLNKQAVETPHKEDIKIPPIQNEKSISDSQNLHKKSKKKKKPSKQRSFCEHCRPQSTGVNSANTDVGISEPSSYPPCSMDEGNHKNDQDRSGSVTDAKLDQSKISADSDRVKKAPKCRRCKRRERNRNIRGCVCITYECVWKVGAVVLCCSFF